MKLVQKLLAEFDNTGKIHTIEEIEEHHDSNAVSQVKFQQDAFTELGNPCVDNSKDLKSLGTNIVMDEKTPKTYSKLKQPASSNLKIIAKVASSITKYQYPTPLRKTNFIFTKPKKDLSKTQKQLKLMKNNVGLFSRLFIACQRRNLKFSNAWSAIKMLLNLHVDAKIIDGAAIINMLRPSTGKTFQDYNTFIPFIAHLLKNVKRLDLVWDRYFDDSLKICTRDKRGTGVRRKVSGNGVLPNNWQTFLRCSENKSELFPFLSKLLVTHVQEKLQSRTKTFERKNC